MPQLARKNETTFIIFTIIVMSRVLFFDTETTGLPKMRTVSALVKPGNWPDLVSISWSVYEDKELVEKQTYIIKPTDWEIPDESIKFHGITEQMAIKTGSDLTVVMTMFKKSLEGCNLVIAHNMEFDRNVVFNAFKWRMNLDPTTFWSYGAELCTMQKAKAELKRPGKGFHPSDPYKFIGLDELYTDTFKRPPPPAAHTADRDVDVLQQIWWSRWS